MTNDFTKSNKKNPKPIAPRIIEYHIPVLTHLEVLPASPSLIIFPDIFNVASSVAIIYAINNNTARGS